MAYDVDSPEVKDVAAPGPLVDDEVAPNVDDIAAWALNVSKDMGTPDLEVADPDAKLDPPAKDDPDPAAKKAAEQDATLATEGRKVLKAKDGVHDIPFERLTESNEARDKALAEKAEIAKQLETAQAELKALQDGAAKGTTTAAAASQSADELEAQIAALEDEAESAREESPWMADQLKGQAKTMRAILAKTHAVQQELAEERTAKTKAVKQEQETSEEAIRLEVNAALDAVPALRYWEKTKPAFYQAAHDIDVDLRDKPEWKDKPFKERFEEVVRQMTVEYGESILPPGSKPAAKPAQRTLPDTAQAGVSSLTDLPGGTPTAQNPLDAVGDAEASALAQSLLNTNMTDEDIIRWATKR